MENKNNPARVRANIAKKGEHGDTVVGHLTKGEIVIPAIIAEDQNLRKLLNTVFEKAGADLEQFTVGSAKNQVNPKTGYPEFGWFSGITKAIKKAVKSVTSMIFGKPPKMPELAKQPVPIEKIQQSNIADDIIRKELAKRRRATLLSKNLSDPNLRIQKLGAGA